MSKSNKKNLLTLIESESKVVSGKRATYGIYKCECGNTIECKVTNVKCGAKTNCGCQKFRKDITGKKFNMLFIDSYEGIIDGHSKWRCICDCGNITFVTHNNIVSGKTKSCGCYHKKIMSERKGIKNKPKEKNIGKTINGYTILEFHESSSIRKCEYYVCKCKCGLVQEISHSNLMTNRYDCIGCKYAGCVYGDIKVIYIESIKPVRACATCKCGKTLVSLLDHIKRMNDCGCVHKEKIMANSIKRMEENPIPKDYMCRLYHSANRRNLSFDLTSDVLYKIFIQQNKKCALSGRLIDISYTDMTASVDRIDSSLGYHKENIQWVHKDINFLKMQYSNEYVITIATLVSNFNGKMEHRDIPKIYIKSPWLYKGVGNFSHSHFTGIKNDAKKRNYTFSVDIDFLYELYLSQCGRCALTGLEIDFKIGRGGTASLDRIDSSIGYEKYNLQWVHTDVNFMKGSMTQEEFKSICKEIYDYNNRH